MRGRETNIDNIARECSVFLTSAHDLQQYHRLLFHGRVFYNNSAPQREAL